MVGEQYVSQHAEGRVTAGSVVVITGVGSLFRKESYRLSAVRDDAVVAFIQCCTFGVGVVIGFVRFEDERHASEQPHQYVVVMRSQEISLSQASVPDFFGSLVTFSRKRLDDSVALSYPHPRRTPDVECESI